MKLFKLIISLILLFLTIAFSRKTLRKNKKNKSKSKYKSKSLSKALSENIPYDDWENILKIANDLSYSKNYKINDYEMENIGDEIKSGATRAVFYLLKSSKTFVISFRGTEGATDYESWMTNFNYAEEEIMGCINDYPMKVHQGFKNAYDIVREEVLNRMIENLENFNNIIVTGHSKGGALAHLAFLDIGCYFNKKSKKESVNLITFGSPKVGNDAFRFNINQLGAILSGLIARFVNGNDIVPSVPPHPFVHCGTLIFIEANNNLRKKYDFQSLVGNLNSSEDSREIIKEKEKYQKFLSSINLSSINDHVNYNSIYPDDVVISLRKLKNMIDPPKEKEVYSWNISNDEGGMRYRGKKN